MFDEKIICFDSCIKNLILRTLRKLIIILIGLSYQTRFYPGLNFSFKSPIEYLHQVASQMVVESKITDFVPYTRILIIRKRQELFLKLFHLGCRTGVSP